MGLREVRREAGGPTYRVLAGRSGLSASTLSAAAAGRQLPSLTVVLAFVRACGADPQGWEERWRTTAADLTAARSEREQTATKDAPASPYIGLLSYRSQDSCWFFGRDRLMAQLSQRVSKGRFTAVVGASGAGKSSLLHAGLLPAWRSEHPDGQTVVLTPGASPLRDCLQRLGADADVPAVESEGSGDRLVHRAVLHALRGSSVPTELLLVVDQFEEVFTLCQEGEEASRFITELLEATGAPDSRLRVVIGLRADFYAHCTDHPALSRILADNQVLVGPMTTAELRQVITGPARQANLTVESALLAELVAGARGRSAALPLLSHVLRETWQRRRGNALTLAAFEATGGMDHALVRTAERAYAELDPLQQRMARAVLLRLTAFGDGAEDVKRRVRREELVLVDGDPTPLLEHFAQARLLVLDHETVEIAHETLIRHWPRLREWLAEDREGLRVHRDMALAARQWEFVGRDAGALYRGVRLERACAWAATRDPHLLSGSEADFLAASTHQRDREQAAARRRRRRLHSLVALMAVLLAGALAATVIAVDSRQEATRQRDQALSERMAQEAEALRRAEPARALQLSLTAYRMSPTATARGTLLSMYATPFARQLRGESAVTAAAVAPLPRSSSIVATGEASGVLRLWSTGRRPRAQVLNSSGPAIRSLAFSPNGSVLASVDARGRATLWQTATGRRMARLWPAKDPGFDGPCAVAFSPDGRFVAVAGPGGAVLLWPAASTGRPLPRAVLGDSRRGYLHAVAFGADSRTMAAAGPGGTQVWHLNDSGTRTTRPTQHLPGAYAAAFAPRGLRLATAGEERVVRVWDLTGSRPRPTSRLTGHTDTIAALSFSPDGRTLASAGVDATVRLWNIAPDERGTAHATLSGHTGQISSLTFASDGRTLVSGSTDRTTRLWELPSPALTGHTSSLYATAFSANGRQLATGSFDRTIRLWDVADLTARPAAQLTGHQAAVNAVAFSPRRRLLASGSLDRTLRLWDTGGSHPGKQLASVPAGQDAVNSVAFAPDGGLLATGSGDRTLRIWDVREPDKPRQIAMRIAHTDQLETVAFSPDGHLLATGSRDHTVRLWDITHPYQPRPLTRLTGHRDAVKTLAFSPDGRTLATAGDDRGLRLWDIAGSHGTRPRLLIERRSLPGPIKALAFAPDGRTLYSAFTDSVGMWDVKDDRSLVSLGQLTGHRAQIDAVSVSPNGRYVATGSEDRTALLWDTDPAAIARRICRTTGPEDLQAGGQDNHLPAPQRPVCPSDQR
ncbi:nSTAND1 domain-containing NTPase [Streptomyces pakalii]|uniref:Helix-turn-helix domain-containing protein n=1 Tax=Streptomyces pakalii TaxID=3036494 RepID=A0ABT7DHY7_9ACTN|nr:AAA family ATPase [Streptomyces pakalii]MDJ1645433.1 helix-turn-helix domain-containing protein [Streptomyces pakalii]